MDDVEECVICLDPFEGSDFYRFECTHRLHKHCCLRYFEYNYNINRNHIRCPVCNRQLNVTKQKRVYFIKKFLAYYCCSFSIVDV